MRLFHWAVYWSIEGEPDLFVDHHDTLTPWGARKRVRNDLEDTYGPLDLDMIIIRSTELRRGAA
jgi:hypothetical protein